MLMERQIACIWNMNLKGEDGLIPGVTAIISKLCARQQVKKWSLNYNLSSRELTGKHQESTPAVPGLFNNNCFLKKKYLLKKIKQIRAFKINLILLNRLQWVLMVLRRGCHWEIPELRCQASIVQGGPPLTLKGRVFNLVLLTSYDLLCCVMICYAASFFDQNLMLSMSKILWSDMLCYAALFYEQNLMLSMSKILWSVMLPFWEIMIEIFVPKPYALLWILI